MQTEYSSYICGYSAKIQHCAACGCRKRCNTRKNKLCLVSRCNDVMLCNVVHISKNNMIVSQYNVKFDHVNVKVSHYKCFFSNQKPMCFCDLCKAPEQKLEEEELLFSHKVTAHFGPAA